MSPPFFSSEVRALQGRSGTPFFQPPFHCEPLLRVPCIASRNQPIPRSYRIIELLPRVLYWIIGHQAFVSICICDFAATAGLIRLGAAAHGSRVRILDCVGAFTKKALAGVHEPGRSRFVRSIANYV